MPEKKPLLVVYRPVGSLIPYIKNARVHDDAQVAQISGSIREFGFTNPVLLDEAGGIIAGHGRVLAARKLALSEVPCIVLEGLSDTQKRAYRLADNRIALNSGWDAELLAVELRALAESGFEATEIGFGRQEIDNILIAFETELGPVDENPWEGMPEHKPHARSYRSVIVHLQDEAAVQDFQQRMGQEMAANAKYIWHPHKPKDAKSEHVWVDDEEDRFEEEEEDVGSSAHGSRSTSRVRAAVMFK